MDRYGGVATVVISGITAPDDVRRHIEDIHPLGDTFSYTMTDDSLMLRLEQGGNTAALGALTSVLDGLNEALDPCTDEGKVFISAVAQPTLDTHWSHG